MSFAEQVPSDEWQPVTDLLDEIADVWFKPEGEKFTYLFRIPRGRLQAADTDRPTVETLLRAAAIPIDDVESWCFEGLPDSGVDGANPQRDDPLPPPPPDATHLAVYVHVRPPARADVGGPDLPPEKWQALEAVWKTILGLEAAIDALRLGMDGLRSEMEAAFKRPMGVEEKVHGLQADVVQWTKAKNRVHYALPKVREFIHRATWAQALPERKRLEDVVKDHIEPRIPHPQIDEVRDQLGHLQKDRQVLFAQGNSVNQECRAILADIQRAFSTLQRNAADRARQKRSAGREKGKHL
ncbi:MAG TPA: hypothetical protein VKD90_02580 [Gemmataceae bacterium]|nr:hypothetical protein [Gemmataceae bacterium]